MANSIKKVRPVLSGLVLLHTHLLLLPFPSTAHAASNLREITGDRGEKHCRVLFGRSVACILPVAGVGTDITHASLDRQMAR